MSDLSVLHAYALDLVCLALLTGVWSLLFYGHRVRASDRHRAQLRADALREADRRRRREAVQRAEQRRSMRRHHGI